MVSILIMSINKDGILTRCLESLEKTSYTNYKIYLCVPPSVRFQIPKVEKYYFVSRYETEPYKYSIFANRLVEACDSEFICLLNDDIEVITENWLEILLDYVESDAKNGIATPKLVFPDNTIQYVGCILDPEIICGLAFYRQQDKLNAIWNQPTYYSAVGTACAVMRKSVYLEVGGMEKDLVAFNDIDLSLKIFMAGYRNIVLPQACLIHHESVTRGQELEFMPQDQKFMRERWGHLLIPNCPNEVNI